MNTGYDLQHVLFINNIQTFHNRGSGRTMSIEPIRRSQMNQMDPNENTNIPDNWHATDKEKREENTDIQMGDTEENLEN